MKILSKMAIIFVLFVCTAGLVIQTKAQPPQEEVDLGILSVEGSIRYPSFQVIENPETLRKVTREALGRELTRIEEEVLRSCGSENETE